MNGFSASLIQPLLNAEEEFRLFRKAKKPHGRSGSKIAEKPHLNKAQ